MLAIAKGALVALAGLSAACATAGNGSKALPDGEVDRTAPAFVVVENNHWQDVVVYAEHLGSRQRLGMISSMGSGRLRLPVRMVGGPDIRLIADPIGGGARWTSPVVRVQNGEAMRMDVENSITLSSLAVSQPTRLGQ